MAILTNVAAAGATARKVSQRLPAADNEVLVAADRLAAINQDLVAILRPDLLGRSDLLADEGDSGTVLAASQLRQIDPGLLQKLRPDLLPAVEGAVGTAAPGSTQSAATAAAAPISRVSPGELITAEKLNLIIDRLNALGGGGSLSLIGDVTGTADANRVVKLQGTALADVVPTEGRVLGYANGAWRPVAPSTGSAAPVAMRLVAAGTVSLGRVGGQTQYVVTSAYGNLRGGGEGSEFSLIFDGYDNRNDYVVHTSQRQVLTEAEYRSGGRNNRRPQTVARIDYPVLGNMATTQGPGLGFKVFQNNEPRDLVDELFVEIYQPPLRFVLLPSVFNQPLVAEAPAAAPALVAATRSAPAAPRKAAAKKVARKAPRKTDR